MCINNEDKLSMKSQSQQSNFINISCDKTMTLQSGLFLVQ